MKATTVEAIHSQTAKLLPIVKQLGEVWQGQPLIPLCEVLIQNLAFSGSDCVNYSLEADIQKIENIRKAIQLLKENSFHNTFIDWLWVEVECIIVGNVMAEDC